MKAQEGWHQDQDEGRGQQMGRGAGDSVLVVGLIDFWPALEERHWQGRCHGNRPSPGAPCQPQLQHTAEQQFLDHRRRHYCRQHQQDPFYPRQRRVAQPREGMLFRLASEKRRGTPGCQAEDDVYERSQAEPRQQAYENALACPVPGEAELVGPGVAHRSEQEDNGEDRDGPGKVHFP
jgi:hypothetical protein